MPKTTGLLAIVIALIAITCLFAPGSCGAAPENYFKVTVLDADTGRGIPLVELKTVNGICYYTDSNGIAAIDDADLVGQKVWFALFSHGYSYPKDGFGYSGVALNVKLGASAVVKMKRVNIAERLYRITGSGIYRDSALVGAPVPIKHPLLDGQVMGQDTVMAAPYKGKIYWFFGDTERPGYPLGQFATSGATSLLPSAGGLDPSAGVDLTYFVDSDGFSKKMLPLPGPGGPIWVGGVFTLVGADGQEHLYTKYVHLKGDISVGEQGLAVFDDKAEVFQPVAKYDTNAALHIDNQPFKVIENGHPYLYCQLGEAFPLVRAAANIAAVSDEHAYEGFSCLAPGGRFDGDNTKLDRGPDGKLNYAWKKDTAVLGFDQEQKLIKAGKLRQDEVLAQLHDVDSNALIDSHGGSVHWNAYRKRWIMIAGQSFGSPSFLGELWYSEADTPVGPWVYARKIITHDNYTFYNPTQHPFFDQDNGRLIYLEGTYTDTYAAKPVVTPRYNYNQIMYRLALDDPRLSLPGPVYRVKGDNGQVHYEVREDLVAKGEWAGVQDIPFFAVAPSRAHDSLVPIQAPGQTGGAAIFYALPAAQGASEKPSSAVVPLYQYADGNGNKWYSTDASLQTATVTRSADPVCRVWQNPASVVALDYAAESAPNLGL
jgi:hypothetical protein